MKYLRIRQQLSVADPLQRELLLRAIKIILEHQEAKNASSDLRQSLDSQSATGGHAFVRAVSKRGRRPGDEVWVIFRRSTSDPTDVKYYLSDAPARVAKTDLVRQADLRWPVETAIEEGKSELGMDHYETRTWRGWHHQMTLTFLAHHFLSRMRLRLQKKPGADTRASQGLN